MAAAAGYAPASRQSKGAGLTWGTVLTLVLHLVVAAGRELLTDPKEVGALRVVTYVPNVPAGPSDTSKARTKSATSPTCLTPPRRQR